MSPPSGNPRLAFFRELFQSSDDLTRLFKPGALPCAAIANAFGVVTDEMNCNLNDIEELREQLLAINAEFERELRARGFDPAQADNVALPSHLAALYAEREQIAAQLEEQGEPTDERD